MQIQPRERTWEFGRERCVLEQGERWGFCGKWRNGSSFDVEVGYGFCRSCSLFFLLVLGTWGNGSCKSKKNWIGEVGNRELWVW